MTEIVEAKTTPIFCREYPCLDRFGLGLTNLTVQPGAPDVDSEPAQPALGMRSERLSSALLRYPDHFGMEQCN